MSAATGDKKSSHPLADATECLADSPVAKDMPVAMPTWHDPDAADRSLDSDATRHIRPAGVTVAGSRGTGIVQRVAGYEILEELGRGGMGVVYKAWQNNLQRPVALKMILAGAFAGPMELERFRAEAMAIARLHHPHLLSIHEIGEANQLPFYAMEYMEGGPLSRRLNGRPIAPRTAAQLVRSLAHAMDYAHKNGIVHRDLKPANILLSGEVGMPLEECIAKITDFGIAKHLNQDSNITRTGDILGTPHYMAPEQAGGDSSQIGPASDVYSLGAILYELLTGRTPFQGHSGPKVLLMSLKEEPEKPTQWAQDIPRDLETICMKCLEKDPAKRYASAGALAEDLLRFMRHEPVEARSSSILDRTIKWTRRRPALAASIAMGVGLVLVAFTLMAGMWRQAVVNTTQQNELLLTTQQNLADAYLERGIHLSEKGDVRRGMHWMMRALEVSQQIEAKQSEPNLLTPIIRMNLASWGQCVYPREKLLPHGDWVWDVAFTRDSRFVATASKDRNVQIWDAGTGHPIGAPLVHPFPVWGVAFHPDGVTMFTICGEIPQGKGRLTVWSADPKHAGRFVQRGEPFESSSEIVRLLLNAPGDRLWLGSNSGGRACLLAFDGKGAGNGLRTIAAPLPGHHVGAEFNLAGEMLATIAGEPTPDGLRASSRIQLWSARDAKPLGDPITLSGLARTVSFTNDGGRLLIGSTIEKEPVTGETSRIVIWDIARGKWTGQQSPPMQGRIRAAAVSSDGEMFAVSVFDHTGRRVAGRLEITDGNVCLWRLRKDGGIESAGTPMRTRHAVWHLEFSPDNRMILAGCENYGAYLWCVSNSQSLTQTIWHDGNCVKVAFSHDGRTAVTASAGGSYSTAARLWEVPTFAHIGPTMTQPDQIKTVYWENDGNHVWVNSGVKHCRWDPYRARLLETIDIPGVAHGIHPTEDDHRFFCELGDSNLQEYNRTTKTWTKLAHQRNGDESGVYYHVRRHGDSVVHLWENPFRVQILNRAGVPQSPMLSRPDTIMYGCLLNTRDDCLAVAESNRRREHAVVLYNAVDFTVRHRLPVQRATAAFAFSPDGQTLAFGGADRQIQQMDVTTGKIAGQPLLHEENVHWVCFLGDNRLLATSSGKGTILIWDVKTGKRIGPAFEHRTDLANISVHPTNKYLLTGSTRTQARIWRLPGSLRGDLNHIRLWVETVTGMEMNASDIIIQLDTNRVMAKREELAKLGGPPLRER